jgi:hypothetical protein
MAITFTVAGLLLTLVGTVCAAVAFVQTWREERPGHRLLPLPRWLGGKRNVTVHSVTGRGTFTVGTSARGWVTIADTAPVDEQIAYLRRAVLTLDGEIGAEAARSTKRDADLTAQIAQVKTSLEGSVVDLRAHTTRVSTGTIQLQLVGIFLVGLGACLAVVPTLFELA